MEIAGEVVRSVVGRIGDYVIGAIGRQISYVVHYGDKVANLKKQSEKLEDLKGSVEQKIEAARRNGEDIDNAVQRWVANVDSATGEARQFLEDEDKASKRCLGGLCINLSLRHRFSRTAAKKTLAITELHEDGRSFERVSHPAPPPGIEASLINDGPSFESRKSAKEKIMEALKDESTHLIGICGMGGVGKTTLLKEIGKEVKESKLFDEVAFSIVSQTPSVTKIQRDIADMLGKKLEVDNESQRAWELSVRIKKEQRVLIILDDVWGRLELREIGLPCGNDHKGCKIVFATRSQDVCSQMDAQRIIPIQVLSKEEAWVLFREMAGEVVDSSGLNGIAREVADECGGLPLAIVALAKGLKNKNKNVWTDAARQLKKCTPSPTISGLQRDVYPILELSFNFLESEEAKSFFLLCCLFPEDDDIDVEDLLRYGIGLRLFQNVDTIEEAEDRTHTVVSTLIASFLLLNGDKKGCVKMHDVVRDVAISIASKTKNIFLVKAGVGLKEWPDSATCHNYSAISLMENDIEELPDHGIECPELQTLLLRGNLSLQIPTNFFQDMRELKVLDLSGTKVSSLPRSLTSLTTLRTLCLDDCRLLGDISMIGSLNKLEILSLSGPCIKEIPLAIGQLTNLRVLDLRDSEYLVNIAPGVISSLRKLEKLYLPSNFHHWEEEEEQEQEQEQEQEEPIRSNASLVELNFLSRLTCLDVCMPNPDFLPTDVHFQDLKKFHITIGNRFNEISKRWDRVLWITLDMRTPILGWIKELLKKTEVLNLVRIMDIKNIFNDLNKECFNELKFLYIESCDEMEYLVNNMESAPQLAFRSLKLLILVELSNFSEICHGQLPAECFSNLQILGVEKCQNMLKIVQSNLLPRLQKLKKLYVSSCNSLEYVFDMEGRVVEEGTMKLLSQLELFELVELPELMHIWKGPHQHMSLCNLKTVKLSCCNELGMLFPPRLVQDLIHLDNLDISYCDSLEEVFGTYKKEETEIVACVPSKVPCLQNLTHLNVNYCSKLRNIFSVTIANSLQQLKSLQVARCKAMEEIIGDEKGEETTPVEKIVFSCLYSMSLDNLANLKRFCPGHYTIEWPSLEILKIEDCPKMETFGCGVQVTPKLKNVQVEDVQLIWKDDLNATVQQIFQKKGDGFGAISPSSFLSIA